jgi:hypothetical protein
VLKCGQNNACSDNCRYVLFLYFIFCLCIHETDDFCFGVERNTLVVPMTQRESTPQPPRRPPRAQQHQQLLALALLAVEAAAAEEAPVLPCKSDRALRLLLPQWVLSLA